MGTEPGLRDVLKHLHVAIEPLADSRPIEMRPSQFTPEQIAEMRRRIDAKEAAATKRDVERRKAMRKRNRGRGV